MIVEWVQRYALLGLGGALALSLVATGVQTLRLKTAETNIATQKAAHVTETQRLSVAAIAAEQAARTEESRRVQALADVVRQQTLRAARAEADAARAAAAGRGLRERAATLAAARGGPASNPAAAAECAPDRAASVVLADVLGGVEQRGRETAAALDKSYSAGIACEQSFDALTHR